MKKVAEIFNAEAAKSAINDATKGIEDVCTKFKSLSEKVASEFGAQGSSLGGQTGILAEGSFMQKSQASFEDLSKKLNSFMGRVDGIVKSNTEAVSTTSSIYGG